MTAQIIDLAQYRRAKVLAEMAQALAGLEREEWEYYAERLENRSIYDSDGSEALARLVTPGD